MIQTPTLYHNDFVYLKKKTSSGSEHLARPLRSGSRVQNIKQFYFLFTIKYFVINISICVPFNVLLRFDLNIPSTVSTNIYLYIYKYMMHRTLPPLLFTFKIGLLIHLIALVVLTCKQTWFCLFICNVSEATPE